LREHFELDATGLNALCDAIKECRTLTDLDISNNYLNGSYNEGMAQLGPIVAASNVNRLGIAGNYLIKNGGLAAIVEMCRTGKLSEIDISRNQIKGGVAGGQVGAMIEGNTTLRVLDLSDQNPGYADGKLDSAFITRFEPFLKSNESLTALALHDNMPLAMFQKAAIQTLCDAKSNQIALSM
jgi:hypothetical protein